MRASSIFLIALFFTIHVLGVLAAKPLDFDGDGKTDFAVLRQRSDGPNTVWDWYIAQSGSGVVRHTQWGLPASDVYVPADFDGDNKTDVAIWRLSSAPGQSYFYILNSSNFSLRVEQFGTEIDDARAIADYDGDGKTDLAVYRTTGFQQQNYFIYRGSLNNPNGNLTFVPWGAGGSTRYAGDFDGDGKADFCVRLLSSGIFAIRRSSDSGIEYVSWGLSNDALAPGDYDGDGKSDFCVRRTVGSQIQWFILERDGGGTGASPIIWGRNAVPLDIPIGSGDYDGDGRSDIGIYRLTENPFNTYFIRRSVDGSMLTFAFGVTGDSVLSPQY